MYFHKHNEKLIRPQKFVKVANIMKQKSCLQKVCKSYAQKHTFGGGFLQSVIKNKQAWKQSVYERTFDHPKKVVHTLCRRS